MKRADEGDVIAAHAFENERNLRIAAKVGLAFSQIKEQIIGEFVQVMIGQLRVALGNSWAVDDQWSETPLIRGAYVAAYKRAWVVEASVGLCCEKTGPSDLDFFVYLEKKERSAAAVQLREALNERYANGNHSGNNPWWKFVDPPFRDLTTEDALIGLWKKDEAALYYASHLLKICQIAGPFLDKLCGK
jgi:hypothetical protein